MSVIKVNNITSRDGTTGPVIAGIATVSTTSHLVVPTGNTGQKVPLAPDPFINNLVLALPFNSESVFDDISPRNQGTFSGEGSVGFGTTTASLPFGVSGVTTTSVGIVTFSKYYGTSCYFDGSSTRYLKSTNNTNLNFGRENFTIEMWVYPTAVSDIRGLYSVSGGSGSNPKFVIHLDSGTPSIHYNTLTDGSNLYTASNSTISANQWSHLAFVRSNSVWTWYINGSSSGSGSNNTDITFGATIPTYIGYGGEGYFAVFNGYLQDLRIYKGVAKYTSNFTPPTQIAL